MSVRKGSKVGVKIGRNLVAGKVKSVTDGVALVELASGVQVNRKVTSLLEPPAPKADGPSSASREEE